MGVYDLGDFPDRAGLYESTVCDADNIRNSKWLTQVVDDNIASSPSSASLPSSPDAKSPGAASEQQQPAQQPEQQQPQEPQQPQQPPATGSSADKKPDPKDSKAPGPARRMN